MLITIDQLVRLKRAGIVNLAGLARAASLSDKALTAKVSRRESGRSSELTVTEAVALAGALEDAFTEAGFRLSEAGSGRAVSGATSEGRTDRPVGVGIAEGQVDGRDSRDADRRTEPPAEHEVDGEGRAWAGRQARVGSDAASGATSGEGDAGHAPPVYDPRSARSSHRPSRRDEDVETMADKMGLEPPKPQRPRKTGRITEFPNR